MCIFSCWIYVVSGCIAHSPLTGSTLPVCVDPSAGGQVAVAGYVHVCEPPTLLKVPPAAVHVATLAALPLEKVPVQFPLASGPDVEVEPVREGHVSVGLPFRHKPPEKSV